MLNMFNAKNIRVDPAGDGNYGANRNGGKRTHNGIDFLAVPGTTVQSPVAGKVTKLGYTYADDLSYRYVEITDDSSRRHRFFYVKPAVAVNDMVFVESIIGTAANICDRYPDREMKNHIHYEVMTAGINPVYLNPMVYLVEMGAGIDPIDWAKVSSDWAKESKVRDATLAEREESHGKYEDNAFLAQKLKQTMAMSGKWGNLSASQQESLHLIATKIARIITGNPNHADSWHDIAGYAKLIEEQLESS